MNAHLKGRSINYKKVSDVDLCLLSGRGLDSGGQNGSCASASAASFGDKSLDDLVNA